MRLATIAAMMLAAPLGACATMSDGPIVDNGPAQPMGSYVALGQPVYVSPDIVVTPTKLYEDSRCPSGVQCVWSGRVVVTTRIDGPGWRETVNLVSGEQLRVRDHDYLLIEVRPAVRPQSGISESDYRFAFRIDYRM